MSAFSDEEDNELINFENLEILDLFEDDSEIDASKCISCGKCTRICPECNELAVNKPSEIYAAINKDGKVLKRSASGGIFYALAESVIAEGGCVFGAMLDEQFQVKHICVEKIEDLPLLQKSKYVQSFIGESYKIALNKLKDGKKVLFSGTPCQVAAMKFLTGKMNENLILVEVVCHGVPSQKFFNDYFLLTVKAFNTDNGLGTDVEIMNNHRIFNSLGGYDHDEEENQNISMLRIFMQNIIQQFRE